MAGGVRYLMFNLETLKHVCILLSIFIVVIIVRCCWSLKSQWNAGPVVTGWTEKTSWVGAFQQKLFYAPSTLNLQGQNLWCPLWALLQKFLMQVHPSNKRTDSPSTLTDSEGTDREEMNLYLRKPFASRHRRCNWRWRRWRTPRWPKRSVFVRRVGPNTAWLVGAGYPVSYPSWISMWCNGRGRWWRKFGWQMGHQI